MAVAQESPRRPLGADLTEVVGVRPRTPRPGVAMVGLLLAAIAYAGFAGGATSPTEGGWLQIGLAVGVIVAAAIWVWHGALPLAASRTTWLGLGLLAAFAAWNGITLIWSDTPDRTWTELNRAMSYTLVLALAIAAASWWERAAERLALGYLAIAVAVALYALGGKIAPVVSVPGVLDLDHTVNFARLRAPLEYWNALALFCAMAVPVALRLAVEPIRSERIRLLGLLATAVLLLTIVLTYSRGGLIAVGVALGVTIALAGDVLRSLVYLAVACLAALPAAVFGLTAGDLTKDGVSAGDRQLEGVVLALLLLAGLAALWFGGRAVLRAGARLTLPPARARQVVPALLAALALALVGATAAMAVSDRGLTGTITHQWDSFRAPNTAKPDDPGRLLSANSENRWVWWREATGAFSDRPLGGWGGGSFAQVHLRYRERAIGVGHPHSVPLQFLAETGLVGALLGIGALVALAVGAVAAVRRRPPGPGRGLAAALTGASVAWIVHGLADWDWSIPGVVLPAMAFFGVLGGRSGEGSITSRWSQFARGVLLAGMALFACGIALSAALPALADSKTSRALVLGASSNPAVLRQAAADAELASRLDPLSPRPLITAATIAERRGDREQARRYLLRALGRQPERADTWFQLAQLDVESGNYSSAQAALKHALSLDPRSAYALGLAHLGTNLLVPPNGSPTATGTPLPTFVGPSGDLAPASASGGP
jgi:hypothetical protein